MIKGYLGRDFEMEGVISSNESIRIDCTLSGSVSSTHSVIVGLSGIVHGQISAPVIKVDGLVEGDLKAGKRVEILENARVTGNVITPAGGLIMKIGGKFCGKLIVGTAPLKVDKKSAVLPFNNPRKKTNTTTQNNPTVLNNSKVG